LDYVDDILAGFVDVGVSGATILDSQGMASAIVNSDKENVPIFGYLKSLLQDAKPYNKTIFTVLESEELVEKAVAVVQKITGHASSSSVGFMFTVPIGKIYPMGLSE
jgi:nitrogen regulatory protein P-II 1